MNRILSVAIYAVIAMVSLPASAQFLKLGVRGGLDFNKANYDEVKNKNYTGFFIGPMAEVT
ncbi:MAG TPA: porin family protein, partial [Bacteroidaceae bacterium]|nr:porin family protein [Bacteroidaceae bacterium]